MVNIEKYVFNLFDLADLDSQASQNRYLTDVIGVMEKPKPLAKIPNKHGAIQQQIKFKITDGSNTIKVTFWDDFAKYFDDVLKQEIDYPIIIIIGCARVNKWSDEVVLSNAAATNFYLNIKHHSVTEMRRMLSKSSFARTNLAAPSIPFPKILTVQGIKNMGVDQTENEVLCQVKIRKLQELRSWFVQVCTSCYKKAEIVGNFYTCVHCPRKGSYAEKKFELCIFASDQTGPIDIMLEDREVRTLIGKTYYELRATMMKVLYKFLKLLRTRIALSK
ncbi:uncharacterized protein LOC141719586 isoform X2 [Apium graveolens]|uniref:uncharacterized protein LOC141719586 isoform X2 n=1 Tax=Apium graveolens TaxID=4045 RepID=UPI003D79173A